MSTTKDTRPDILLIMPDQMRGDCLSLEGHPVLQTPSIDAIGAHGVHFTRAYSTCPSCIPARRALLSGRFPAANGMVGYLDGQELTLPTFTERLQEGGYHTTLVGRNMHQFPYEKPYGYTDRLLGSAYIESDTYGQALEAAFPGQGGIRSHGLSCNGWTACPWHFPDTWHPTTWVTSRVCEKIRAAPDDRPHFLTASFLAPHPPLLPPAFHFEHFLRRPLPERAIGGWAVPPVKGHMQEPADCDRLDSAPRPLIDANRVDLHGEALREAQAGYFGLIRHLDGQVYRMMIEFRQNCVRRGRPWLVIFTSDHGEMLGDHYLFRKSEPYEGSARIPFLIQASPELGLAQGARHDGAVCLEDIGPTVLDAAGIEPDAKLDGRSLLPVMRGEAECVRDVLHCEHSPGYDNDQAFQMLTDGRLKYIWRPHTGAEQLFDLTTDPQECTDLAAQPEHAAVVARWRERMIAQLDGRPEGFVSDGHLVAGRRYAEMVPVGS